MMEWERFNLGRWTLEAPKEPGLYVVAANVGENKDGSPRYEVCNNPIPVVFVEGELWVIHGPSRKWGGLWWSERLPENMGLPEPIPQNIVRIRPRMDGDPTKKETP